MFSVDLDGTFEWTYEAGRSFGIEGVEQWVKAWVRNRMKRWEGTTLDLRVEPPPFFGSYTVKGTFHARNIKVEADTDLEAIRAAQQMLTKLMSDNDVCSAPRLNFTRSRARENVDA